MPTPKKAISDTLWLMKHLNIKGAFEWIWGRVRLTLEFILVLSLIFSGWRYNIQAQELADVQAQHGQLEEGLHQRISIVNGQLEILRREKDKVRVERVYVPPEGSVVIKQKDLEAIMSRYQNLLKQLSNATTAEERAKLQAEIDRLNADMNSNVEVSVKDWGLTLKPGFGMEWAGLGLSPRLDFKLFYFKRYSLLTGGGKDGLDVSVSRHLDDVLFFRPKNIEGFAGYKFVRVPGAGAFVIGVRSNF